mgnify:CR=1 FL=1
MLPNAKILGASYPDTHGQAKVGNQKTDITFHFD